MIGQPVFEKEMFENNGRILIWGRQGHPNRLGSEFIFYEKHKPSITLAICCNFFQLNDFIHVTVSNIKTHCSSNLTYIPMLTQVHQLHKLYTKTEDDRTSEEDSLTKGFYHKFVGMAATLVM